MSRRFEYAAINGRKFVRRATSPRNSADNVIKKIQVPAYWPALTGVQSLENKGVEVEVKKTIIMSPIDISIDDEGESIPGIEVDEAMPFIASVIVLIVPDVEVIVGIDDMDMDMFVASFPPLTNFVV